MRRCFHHGRCHRQLLSLWLSSGFKFLRLPAPERLARRILHEHECVQFVRHILPRPSGFAFDRSKMIAGLPASFVSPVGPLGGSVDPFLPADLDGPTLPPGGAPATFVGFPGQSTNPNYTTY